MHIPPDPAPVSSFHMKINLVSRSDIQNTIKYICSKTQTASLESIDQQLFCAFPGRCSKTFNSVAILYLVLKSLYLFLLSLLEKLCPDLNTSPPTPNTSPPSFAILSTPRAMALDATALVAALHSVALVAHLREGRHRPHRWESI